MHEHARRDNELATFTDKLLAGEEPETMNDQEELTVVVRQLYDVIAPHEKPDPAFRERLTQRLELEWHLLHNRPARWWQTPKARRAAALAAGLAMLVAAAMWFSAQSENGKSTLKGTALGPTTGALVVALLVLGVLGLVALYRRR